MPNLLWNRVIVENEENKEEQTKAKEANGDLELGGAVVSGSLMELINCL